MARIRTVKPEFFQDEALASCTPHARLLAIALLQLCDGHGLFRAVPMQVHAHAFPWEAEVNTPALLGELEGVGYLYLYEVAGKRYGCIPGFRRHQRLGGKEAQADSFYPSPDQGVIVGEATGKQGNASPGSAPPLHGEAQGCAGTGNREPGNLVPGTGEPGTGEPGVSPSARAPSGAPCNGANGGAHRFEEFWAVWPRKRDKQKARKVWISKRLDDKADALIHDVRERLRRDWQWIKDGGEFIPHPTTYLRGERWEDEFTQPNQGRARSGVDEWLEQQQEGRSDG